MTQNQAQYYPPMPQARHRHRQLSPIERSLDLPGGGQLRVCYRLVKGSRNVGNENCICSYGLNPDTNEIESYFSTQDTAALEIEVDNHSEHNLKHLRLSDIRILTFGEGHQPGPPVEARLPDGNLLIEIVPSEIYYGHLGPHGHEKKYLSVITRGIAAGVYCVQMDIKYDIEQCTIRIDMPLGVMPD